MEWWGNLGSSAAVPQDYGRWQHGLAAGRQSARLPVPPSPCDRSPRATRIWHVVQVAAAQIRRRRPVPRPFTITWAPRRTGLTNWMFNEPLGGSAGSTHLHRIWRDESTWRIQSRCKVCPEAIGESADIVAADCWDGGGPSGEDDGVNAVLVRTRAGAALFDAAVAAGSLTVLRDITFRDTDRFQPDQVRHKRAVWARMCGIRATRGRAPSVRDLRVRRRISLPPASRRRRPRRSVRDTRTVPCGRATP